MKPSKKRIYVSLHYKSHKLFCDLKNELILNNYSIKKIDWVHFDNKIINLLDYINHTSK